MSHQKFKAQNVERGAQILELWLVWISKLGAKYCTPEIDTSEIIVDVQWHLPTYFQWHLPTQFHLSVLLSKGLSLVQWIMLEMCPMHFQ